jgi:hypothetical protein
MIIPNKAHEKVLIQNKVKEIKRDNIFTQKDRILLRLVDERFLTSGDFIGMKIFRYSSRIHEIKDDWDIEIKCDVYQDKKGSKIGIYWLPAIHKTPVIKNGLKKVNRGAY